MDDVATRITVDLVTRLRDKTAVVGVIGLGYVGLPICLAAARAGLRVIGFDIDAEKPRRLLAGESYLRHIPADHVRTAVNAHAFTATTDFAELRTVDAMLVCVPTPLDAHFEPDLTFIVSTARTIAEHLRPGQLVVLESTTYPGTTAEVLRPLLETSGLRCDSDFHVAFSPEREDPGNPDFTTSNIPKVVGADSPAALEAALTLYGHFFARLVPVSSSKVAEAVKLTENIFRSVNIALVNELKIIFDAMDIDVWEVIESAKTKPFGFMPFYPGPGLGGHCIPIDPFYLSWKAREYGVATRFIELAGEINSAMPRHVVGKLAEAIDMRARKGLNGSRILVVGVAYKKNIDDMRESPSLRLIELLEARGAVVRFFDPFVPVIPPSREHAGLTGRRSEPWSPMIGRDQDAVLIVTDHDDVDYATLVESASLVVDTRNVCRRVGIQSDKIVRA